MVGGGEQAARTTGREEDTDDSDDSLMDLAAVRPIGATPIDALRPDAPSPGSIGITYSRTGSHAPPASAAVHLAAKRPEPIAVPPPTNAQAAAQPQPQTHTERLSEPEPKPR